MTGRFRAWASSSKTVAYPTVLCAFGGSVSRELSRRVMFRLIGFTGKGDVKGVADPGDSVTNIW